MGSPETPVEEGVPKPVEEKSELDKKSKLALTLIQALKEEMDAKFNAMKQTVEQDIGNDLTVAKEQIKLKEESIKVQEKAIQTLLKENIKRQDDIFKLTELVQKLLFLEAGDVRTTDDLKDAVALFKIKQNNQ